VHFLAVNYSVVLLKLLPLLLVLLLLPLLVAVQYHHHPAVLFLLQALVAQSLVALQVVQSPPLPLAESSAHHLAPEQLALPLALVTSAHLILTRLTVIPKAINSVATTLLLLVLQDFLFALVLL
jgi:hypothetical protein